jgi:2-oxoisovalerate dehydrogenase E1 component alpha subunit
VNPNVSEANALLPPNEPVHLLDPDGTYHEDPEHPLDLDDDQLRELYRFMVVTRKVDREAINLQRQGQLGVYASCMGQEAAQVGSAYALRDEDWIFPSYRELGAALVREVDAVGLLQLYRGTWLSDHDPYQHNFALMAIPIGTQALHAAGFAMGARFEDNPIVSMVYFGDGGTSEGDPHEAMTFAGVFKAPVVFFVQNNQYAISVPLERQTAAPTLAHKAVGYGLPGLRCDGNDVLASYAVTQKAVERARRGEGPAFIEALTYRMEAHTTSDDPTRYRTQEELDEAAKTDPIARMRNFLTQRDLYDDALEQEIDEQAKDTASTVRAGIYDAPHGDPMELFEHVYVDPTGFFEGQREVLAAELQEGGDA